MSYENDLRELKNRRSGCIAFAKMKKTIYFALNGIEKGPVGVTNISKALESMYKTTKQIRCESNDSYTIIDPSKYYNYVYTNVAQTKRHTLDKLGTLEIIDIIPPMKYSSSYINGNWTCCERKILGYLYNNKKINSMYDPMELFVTKRPCLLCVSLVSKAYYLDDGLYMKTDLYKHKIVGTNRMIIDRKFK